MERTVKRMCYDEGTLQAYIDGALDQDWSETDLKQLKAHLNECIPCRNLYNHLKQSDMMFESLLSDGMQLPSNNSFQVESPNNNRRFSTMIKQQQKHIAAAAAVAIAVGVFAFQPTMADQFLKLFRQEQVQSVSITKDDLNQLENFFSQKEGKFEFKDLMNVESTLEDSDFTRIDKGTFADIKEKFPEVELFPLAEKQEYVDIDHIQKQTLTFTLNSEKCNALLENLGEKSRLPESINQKPITFRFGDTYSYRIVQEGAKGDDYKSSISVNYTRFPQVEIPKDVDENELLNTLNTLNFIPYNLKSQLTSLDMKSTFAIPYSEEQQTSEDLQINGSKAVLIRDKSDDYYSLYFKKGDNLFVVSGNGDYSKIIQQVEAFK